MVKTVILTGAQRCGSQFSPRHSVTQSPLVWTAGEALAPRLEPTSCADARCVGVWVWGWGVGGRVCSRTRSCVVSGWRCRAAATAATRSQPPPAWALSPSSSPWFALALHAHIRHLSVSHAPPLIHRPSTPNSSLRSVRGALSGQRLLINAYSEVPSESKASRKLAEERIEHTAHDMHLVRNRGGGRGTWTTDDDYA